ncbi:hypothetical protein [Methylomonas sp. UP202]|uniref:hypothetical protein n=1 Tax=Methylomonas sp. UP202 TaxID=3040943 RepID=UPI00247AB657|nr:hypothetical protein [Methylomonas sp. UP202]WGS84255.1 hypothetical protein QC632_14465 [Methylomonas sp. UP202]
MSILRCSIALLITTKVFAEGKVLSFDERVVLAKEVEARPSARHYLNETFYPAIGTLGPVVQECLKQPNASTERFSLVADIDLAGKFINVDYQPKTVTAACFSHAIRDLTIHAPPTCDCARLPIVIEMNIAP